MTKKVEFIRKFDSSPCHKCNGWGLLRKLYPGISKEEKAKRVCPVCKGTGKWTEDNFHLIVEHPNGQKIAFQTEGFS